LSAQRLAPSSIVQITMASILKLKSSDDKVFTIDKELAKVTSLTIRVTLMEFTNNESDPNFVLSLSPLVHSSVLAKLIEWLNHHKEEVKNLTPEEVHHDTLELSEWDQAFFNMEQAELLGVIKAAITLGINLLWKMACKTASRHDLHLLLIMLTEMKDKIPRVRAEIQHRQ
jgi:S-phase kinase-associated protein 1